MYDDTNDDARDFCGVGAIYMFDGDYTIFAKSDK
tara:strand:+ start:292 stop:393 length:102 start_codon:yes stop_codon:yes gene_type:complete